MRMLNRLKRVIVESYVGAIALGYLLAQSLLHFVGIFSWPVARWISRGEYREIVPHASAVVGFSFRDALPELVNFLVSLIVWYVLLRWLYFKPLEGEKAEPRLNTEQSG